MSEHTWICVCVSAFRGGHLGCRDLDTCGPGPSGLHWRHPHLWPGILQECCIPPDCFWCLCFPGGLLWLLWGHQEQQVSAGICEWMCQTLDFRQRMTWLDTLLRFVGWGARLKASDTEWRDWTLCVGQDLWVDMSDSRFQTENDVTGYTVSVGIGEWTCQTLDFRERMTRFESVSVSSATACFAAWCVWLYSCFLCVFFNSVFHTRSRNLQV